MDKSITQLTALTTADQADVYPIVDVSASETKKITQNNLEDTIADSSNFVDGLVANTYFIDEVGTTLANDTNFIDELTQNTNFQNAVNNFTTGGASGGGSSSKPMTFAITSAGSGSLNPTTGYQDREAIAFNAGNVNFYLQDATGYIQVRDVSTDWADADRTAGHALIGNNLYLLLLNTGGSPSARIYKYDASDLSLGGTQMTISGITLTYNVNLVMTSNGTKLYVNFAAGTTANAHEIAGFTVSGTTATYVSTVTCGASGTPFTYTFAVTSAEKYYGFDTDVLTQYGNTGTLTYTSDASGASSAALINWGDTLYAGESSTGLCIKLYLPDTEITPTGIQVKTVELTSAQILALDGTPVTLVPAQGANTVVVVDRVVGYLDAGTQYVGGSNIVTNYAGSSIDLVEPFTPADLILSSIDKINSSSPVSESGSSIELTTGINQPVELSAIGAAYTTGTGTLKMYVTYHVITL